MVMADAVVGIMREQEKEYSLGGDPMLVGVRDMLSQLHMLLSVRQEVSHPLVGGHRKLSREEHVLSSNMLFQK